MLQERLMVINFNTMRIFRNCVPGFINNVFIGSQRFFHVTSSVDHENRKLFPTSPLSLRYVARKCDSLDVTVRESGVVKEAILRGKAATDIQNIFLSNFIREHEEASSKQWKAILDKVFEFQHGMIHEQNIDGKVLDVCFGMKKLSLARSYLNFLKSSGKKFNSVTVCGFIKLCHEYEALMMNDDKQRIQLFTKYLLTKHKILDSIIGDAVIKGLILCGMGEKSFKVLEDSQETVAFAPTTYAALASYLIKNDEPDRAFDYIRLMLCKNYVTEHKVFMDWIEHYENDRRKLDDLLEFFGEMDIKPSESTCNRLISVYAKFPHPLKLEGVYGHVKNSGECSVCHRPLQRVDVSKKEFDEMRGSFLKSVLVGNDVFQNTTPQELRQFMSFVEKNAPFDIILDGLNIAYMSGTSCSSKVFVGLTKGVIQYFAEQESKMLLIGRKHMKKWPDFLSTLDEFNVKHFFIDDISEDDLFIIYSALYSGLETNFVTRDLLRSEKLALSDEHQSLFKRWQQSHQIFITYVAPSGKVYTKTPISFQMSVQKTASDGWHVPYTSGSDSNIGKEDYGIHRNWLCLDRYLL